MARVRVHSLATSLDGFVAGPDQSLENPLGVGGERIFEDLGSGRPAQYQVAEVAKSEAAVHALVARGSVRRETGAGAVGAGS